MSFRSEQAFPAGLPTRNGKKASASERITATLVVAAVVPLVWAASVLDADRTSWILTTVLVVPSLAFWGLGARSNEHGREAVPRTTHAHLQGQRFPVSGCGTPGLGN